MNLPDYGVSDHYFWTVELRSRGPARFLAAGFLAIWLCGWLAGEVFALAAVLTMLFGAVLPAIIAERLPEITAAGSGLFTVVFLLVWLTFWTFGGYFAARQLLNLLWGRESISAAAETILVRNGIGPFVSEKKLVRRKIKNIRMKKLSGPVTAETADGVVTVAALGTREERVTLRDRLRESLRIQVTETGAGEGDIELPALWEKAVDVTGAPILRRSRSAQTRAARIAWIVATMAGLGLALVLSRSITGSGGEVPGGVILITGGIVLVAAFGGVLLTWGKDEFVARYRSLEVRRGVGSFMKSRVYPEPALSIHFRVDSDGDEFYSLVVTIGDRDRALLSAMNEAREPVMIGRWLAREMCTELKIASEVRSALVA